jgi:hypothetical protein
MAWIAAVVGALGQMYSANQQKKASDKISNQQNRLYSIQADQLESMAPYAKDFYGKAKAAYEPAFSYYRAVAGNDRGQMMAAVAPEIQANNQKYATQIAASRALNARGGANAAYNTDLFYRAGDENQAALNAQRQAAFANLVKMAGTAGDLGSSAAGRGTEAGNGASGILASMGITAANNAKQQAEAYAQIGKALADSIGYNQNSGWYIGNNPGRG